jgi:glutamate dehydrogenase (NAD(P)+)
MDDIFKFSDDLGPAKVIHVYEPALPLRAVLVVDNVAAGPSIGGIRMAADVSTQECVRLARAMTLKNAAADLSHGGGKAVLYGDPKMPIEKKEALIRGLARALRDISEYILAPDMGTDEQCMAWIKDEVDRVVGLPAEIGGIPLDEIGATGWGLSHAAEVALRYCNFKMDGARLVVQGFGAVGRHAASFMTANGAVLVGVADSRGSIHDPAGLDIGTLLELKQAGKSVIDYPGAKHLDGDSLIDLECDIWIPAARPDVIREDNVARLRTRLVVQGANIPMTPGAEQALHARGVLCIPDFIANAGGVICAAMEYRGSSETAAMQAIQEKIRRNTEQILKEVKDRQILPREAAVNLALGRVRKAMSFKRFTIY